MPHSNFFKKLQEKKAKLNNGEKTSFKKKIQKQRSDNNPSSGNQKMDLKHIETGVPKLFNPRQKKPFSREDFTPIKSIYGSSYPGSETITSLETWLDKALKNAQVRIKKANTEDYHSISKLVHNEELNISYSDTEKANSKQKENLLGFTQAVMTNNPVITKSGNKHFVYTIHNTKDEAIGLVHFIISPNRHCELLTLSVSPDYQNKGLGSLLISKVIIESLKNNCIEISDNYSSEPHSLAQLSKFGFAPDDKRSSINVRTSKPKQSLNEWLDKPLEEKIHTIQQETPNQVTLFLEHVKSQRFFLERLHFLAHGKVVSNQFFTSDKDVMDEDTDKYLIDEAKAYHDLEMMHKAILELQDSGILNLTQAEDKKIYELFDNLKINLLSIQCYLEGAFIENISGAFLAIQTDLKEIEVLQRVIQENDESPYLLILPYLFDIQNHLEKLEENMIVNPGTVETNKFLT